MPVTEPPSTPPPVAEAKADAAFLPARLVDLFRLSTIEQRALYHLLSSPTSLSVATLAERLELEIASTIALLAPEGILRGRALVEAEARWLLPNDSLTAGRGLHLWCAEADKLPVDDAALFSGHAPGISYFAAPAPGTGWAHDLVGEKRPAAVAEVIRDHLGTGQAVALWLSAVATTDVLPLVAALRARLARPVVLIDAAGLIGEPFAELYAVLLRLRRDADLRGAAIVVSDVKQLGGAWRALCQPRPAGQTAPVILCGTDVTPPLGKLPPGAAFETALAMTAATLHRAAPPPAAAATNNSDEANEDPALLASREEARRRAALDAARAMGRPIPPELGEPSKPAPPAAPKPATAPPPTAPTAYRPPAPTAAPPPPPAEAGPPPAARPANPRLAAALAKAGLPPAGSTAYQSDDQFTRRPAGEAAAAAEPPPAPAASPPVVQAAAPLPTVPGPAEPIEAPAAAIEAPADDQPPLPVEENAPLDELLRIVRATPNNAQRIQIMQGLAGKRTPAVIQLYRSNLTNQHPGVRAAAEAGMAGLFGANWNRARAIAPPIQPPRSDDGGRGPGGAF